MANDLPPLNWQSPISGPDGKPSPQFIQLWNRLMDLLNPVNLIGSYLSNDSFVVATASDGTGGDYSEAGGQFIVFWGDDDVTSEAEFSVVSTTGGLTIDGTPNVSIDENGLYTVTGLTELNGTATFRATYNKKYVDRIYSISKSVAGTDGVDGATGGSISVTASRYAITYDGAGALDPASQTNTFSVQKHGVTGTCSWTIVDNLGNTLTPATYLSGTTGDNVTMTAANFAAALAVNGATALTVTGSVTDGDVFTDSVTVIKVQDGTTVLTAYLTNEAITLQANSSGTVSSFSEAVGNFVVYYGDDDVTSSCTFAEVSETGCTGEINTAVNTPVTGQAKGYYRINTMSADNATYVISATYNGQTIEKTVSLAKSKAGTDGSTAKVISVNSTYQTIVYDGTGSPSPTTQTNTFTVTKVNTTATCNWTIVDNLGNSLTPATYLSAASGDSVTMTEANFAAALAVNGATGLTVTGTVVDGITLADSVSVVKIRAGTTAVIGFLTNESITLQASSSGTVSSFATAEGYFKVYSGTTDVTASATFAEVLETGCTGTINTADNTPVAGKVKGYYQITAMSADTATYDVSGTYSGVTLEKRVALAKAKAGATGATGATGSTGATGATGAAGANGQRTANLYMYKWSASTPTTWPSGSVTYTWATDTFTDPGTLNGWSRAIPSHPGGAVKLWRIRQVFTDTDTSATDSVTWTGTYTPEEYIPTIGDLAALNTVATAKIDSNAVTLLTAAFTTGLTTKTSGSWQSVQTITFTANGSPVLINGGILALGATDTLYLMRIKRGATVVWTATAYFTALTAFTYGTASVALVDTPSAGSVTYDLEINPSTDSVYAYDRFLSALETKR